MPSLIAWAALSVITPLADAHSCTPEYTPAADVVLNQPTVALVTHASAYFDQLRQTKPAVDRAVATMKRRGLPVIYLHDRDHASNPEWMYLYDDWNPTAFVDSDIGFYDFDMSSVRHVVCLGGFFWCCERNTVSDTIRLWQRDAPEHDLRITQVVDGIFDVAEAVIPPYRKRVRKFQTDVLWTQHPQASITLKQILRLIDDDDMAVEFLSRQLQTLPNNVNVTIDYFGYRVKIRNATRTPGNRILAANFKPTTTVSYEANEAPSLSQQVSLKKPASNKPQKQKHENKKETRRIPELVIAFRTSHSFLTKSHTTSRRGLSSAFEKFARWPQTLEKLARPKR